MCCCNEEDFIFTDYSKICTGCGRELPILKLDSFNLFSAPLMKTYSRKLRFKIKVSKILGLHSGPKITDPIWKYLSEQPMENPNDVRHAIRTSNLKYKHYDCIRLFSNIFTPFKIITGDVRNIEKLLMHDFDKIFIKWSQGEKASFFSYDWLLRYFLTKIDSPLLVYMKPLICLKKHKKYLMKYNCLMKLGVVEKHAMVWH